MTKMKKVCMTVWNEFLTDARVTKEAETLVSAGFAVTIIAIHTEGRTKAHEFHSSGFEVVRVAKRVPRLIHLIFFPGQHFRAWKNRPHGGKPEKSLPTPPPALTPVRRFLSAIGMAVGSWRMLRAAMKTRADVYHVHDVNTLFVGWLASALRRKPFIYDAHEISTDREGYRGIARLVHFLERNLMPRAAATITTTEMRAEHFHVEYGVRKPIVLQNRPRFQEIPERKRLRLELGIGKDRFVVLYQGGLQAGRGLRNLVRVAERVPDADFVLIGGGRQALTLAELISRKDLDARVHMIPTVQLAELPNYTADADIGIQILRNTCLNHLTTDSNKLFEYIMMGLPVVASDFPEIRKVVDSNRLGILVDPENIDGIVSAIRLMIDNKDFREGCRSRCMEVARLWSWEAQEQELAALYRQLPE